MKPTLRLQQSPLSPHLQIYRRMDHGDVNSAPHHWRGILFGYVASHQRSGFDVGGIFPIPKEIRGLNMRADGAFEFFKGGIAKNTRSEANICAPQSAKTT